MEHATRRAARRCRPAVVVGLAAGGAVAGLAGCIARSARRAARPLSADEEEAARTVFGDSLDYRRVRVGESAVLGAFGYARTPFETAYFPPGATASPGYLPWLIHELGHVWETEHGVAFTRKLWWALHAAAGNPYDYGGPAGLRRAAATGRRFEDFNTEQQAEICRDAYRVLAAGRDAGAFEPFLGQLRSQPPRPRRRGRRRG
jgi:hypothetical protein